MSAFDVDWLRAHVEDLARHDMTVLLPLSPHMREVFGTAFSDAAWRKHGSYFAHNLSEIYAECYAVAHLGKRPSAYWIVTCACELFANSSNVEMPWQGQDGWERDELDEEIPGQPTCAVGCEDEAATMRARERVRSLCAEYVVAFEAFFAAKEVSVAVANCFRCVQIAAALIWVVMGARSAALDSG